MVDGRDAELNGFGRRREEGTQDGVIGDVHEGHHGVPAFVVVPHLAGRTGISFAICKSAETEVLWAACLITHFSIMMMHLDVEFTLHVP